MHISTPLLDKVEKFAIKMMVEDLSNKFIYHDVSHLKTVLSGAEEIGKAEDLSDEEFEKVYLILLFYFLGLTDSDNFGKMDGPVELFMNCKKCSLDIAKKFLEKQEYTKEKTEDLLALLSEAYPKKKMKEEEPESRLMKVVVDALRIDYGKPKAKQRLRLLHEELLLFNAVDVSSKGFNQLSFEYLSHSSYYSKFGKEVLEPKKNELLLKMQKEVKNAQKTEDLVLKKELNITDAELKDLKKSLKSVKGRDDRAIQTLFRTTIKNHYTLNEMVDKKANIMISVNAIILSLILGGVIGESHHDQGMEIVPQIFLALTSIFSIIFAILAIRPELSHGKFTEEEVRNKKGNLLYYGNFHNMVLKDFEWGMYQMLNDSDYLYSTMIRDLYYLGKMLNRKNRLIRTSLVLFMFGFIITLASFFLVEFWWVIL